MKEQSIAMVAAPASCATRLFSKFEQLFAGSVLQLYSLTRDLQRFARHESLTAESVRQLAAGLEAVLTKRLARDFVVGS